jgi:hypothetical protein
MEGYCPRHSKEILETGGDDWPYGACDWELRIGWEELKNKLNQTNVLFELNICVTTCLLNR